MLQATRSLIPVVLMAGLLVSCGDSVTPALDIGSLPPLSPAVATTVASTTTTASTAGGPTQPQPPVTSEPVSSSVLSERDQVGADFLAALAARERCDYDPVGCDFAAIAVPDSPMDRFTRQKMQVRVDSNLRAVPGNGTLRIRVESVSITGQSASVISCVYDTVVIFDVGRSAAASDDIVFDELKQSDRVRWELRQGDGDGDGDGDGRWLILRGDQIQTLTGSDLCEF